MRESTKKQAGNRGMGRKKGVPNKVTASIKAAFVAAFEQRGGVKALVKWAEGNETEFYKLASKLIPTEVSASVSGSVGVVILPSVKRE